MRVFVIDDDPAILRLVDQVLRGLGHEPVLFSHAEELSQVAEPPEAAIVDWHLGDQSCEALVTDLRQKHPGLPTMIMTADCDLDLIQRALSLGAKGWWLKNTGIDNLRRQAAGLISSPSQRASA